MKGSADLCVEGLLLGGDVEDLGGVYDLDTALEPTGLALRVLLPLLGDLALLVEGDLALLVEGDLDGLLTECRWLNIVLLGNMLKLYCLVGNLARV